MLQTETVEKQTFELLKRLMQDPFLSNFLLAGGTSLALQLGHRKSIDLDMFAYQEFDALEMEKHFLDNYNFVARRVFEKNTVLGYIDGIKVDFVSHLYPLLNQPFIEDDIRMYSLQDIACMKLVAISDNGTRLKDFVDIAFLSTKMSLNEMLSAYSKKYNRSNYFHAVKGLSYFGDIDFNVQIDLANNKKFDWEKIEKRIIEMIKFENKIFESLI
jgi:predicted nucleotidyltransferase component of viral defense system